MLLLRSQRVLQRVVVHRTLQRSNTSSIAPSSRRCLVSHSFLSRGSAPRNLGGRSRRPFSANVSNGPEVVEVESGSMHDLCRKHMELPAQEFALGCKYQCSGEVMLRLLLGATNAVKLNSQSSLFLCLYSLGNFLYQVALGVQPEQLETILKDRPSLVNFRK